MQHPGAAHAVAGVDMAVNQVLGGVPIQQGEEGGKAAFLSPLLKRTKPSPWGWLSVSGCAAYGQLMPCG